MVPLEIEPWLPRSNAAKLKLHPMNTGCRATRGPNLDRQPRRALAVSPPDAAAMRRRAIATAVVGGSHEDSASSRASSASPAGLYHLMYTARRFFIIALHLAPDELKVVRTGPWPCVCSGGSRQGPTLHLSHLRRCYFSRC